ncbi:hypothetical protein [Xanthocytophaga flava]|uniref:hypothetical protein n=1 Tax=Xanthocytophaga flava TaxID=3048013 RepID=UPI0028D909A4|nr:hypothetical protein [Xanthocytophaga flavus]MDJ1466957.1 hypothetical protein [Xanthocytophaga flavus]
MRIPQVLEQLQTELASLQAEVRRLQASHTGQAKRITMADAENQLGVSRFHIRRLIGAGIIQSGQRIGAGKNAKWTFDYQEILHLVKNPSFLNIESVS